MENKVISPEHIIGSSRYNSKHSPNQAVINGGEGWIPKREEERSGKNPWLQINLPSVQDICGVATQGKMFFFWISCYNITVNFFKNKPFFQLTTFSTLIIAKKLFSKPKTG